MPVFEDAAAPTAPRGTCLLSHAGKGETNDWRVFMYAGGDLVAWEGGQDADALQSMVFAVGKEHGFEPLRDWFKALYEVLLGASEGPRFGGFVALYGVAETVALMDRGLAGELVS